MFAAIPGCSGLTQAGGSPGHHHDEQEEECGHHDHDEEEEKYDHHDHEEQEVCHIRCDDSRLAAHPVQLIACFKQLCPGLTVKALRNLPNTVGYKC